MNSTGGWFFSNRKETYTSATLKTEWTTDFNIERIRSVIVDWESDLHPKNIDADLSITRFNNPEMETDEIYHWYYSMKWEKKIYVWSTGYYTFDIVYSRWPTVYTINDKNKEIDLPQWLIWALQFLTLWTSMPVYMEQGASLANQYYSMYNEIMNEYMTSVWFLSPHTNLTA